MPFSDSLVQKELRSIRREAVPTENVKHYSSTFRINADIESFQIAISATNLTAAIAVDLEVNYDNGLATEVWYPLVANLITGLDNNFKLAVHNQKTAGNAPYYRLAYNTGAVTAGAGTLTTHVVSVR
jgi:hypothetical protein